MSLGGICRFIVWAAVLSAVPLSADSIIKPGPPDSMRVDAVEKALLPVAAVIPPATDRAYWEKAGQLPYLREHIARAEAAMELQPPDPSEWLDAFLEFSRSGNRNRWERLVDPVKESVRLLSLAECVENKGRFIPVLEKRIREFCSWPTWVSCAHDQELKNLHGEEIWIDLMSSQLAADLSCSMLLLGDRLDPDVQKLLRANLRKRILEPFREKLNGKSRPDFWMTTTNNWNVVCLSGVVVTALAASESKDELAWVIAGSERLVGNFLSGFSSHGYCSEGLGYWGYGFGHYIVMAEYLRRLTGGWLDLFDSPRARAAALFPLGLEVCPGVYPAFADCPVDVGLPQTWAWYVVRRMGLDPEMAKLTKHPSQEAFYLYGRLLFIDPESIPSADLGSDSSSFDPLRRFFPDAGVLVSRLPGPGGFGMAVKAGNNGEHHNHNDVGSFVIAAQGKPVLCDPGKEHYTRDTFSNKRYLSPVHNSFGHSVPVVAGQLQKTGSAYAGTIISSEFSANTDRIAIDLSGAYSVDSLESLVRTVEMDRGSRIVTITDTVQFSEPQSFSTALVSYGSIARDGSRIHIADVPAIVVVDVSVTGAKPVFQQQALTANWQNDRAKPPSRLDIACDEPVTKATIRCVIRIQ